MTVFVGAPIGFRGTGNPVKIWIGPTFISWFDKLAQIRRALDSVPGVLAGYNSE
jgi:hypothetical protein